MDAKAIAAGAIGAAGLGSLTADFGRTRLAEIARAAADARADQAEGDGALRADGTGDARATRP